MKPYIICHMLSSVDRRTDSDGIDAVTTEGEYEATSEQIKATPGSADAARCRRSSTTSVDFS